MPTPDPAKSQAPNSAVRRLNFPRLKPSGRFRIDWGNQNPLLRGPVIADPYSPHKNVIGQHKGQYAHQAALAVATGRLAPNHVPDFSFTDSPFKIGDTEWQRRNWHKIVTMDPWGHMIVENFGSLLKEGIVIHPTIAITKGHILIPELACLNINFLRKFSAEKGVAVEDILKLNLAQLGNSNPEKDHMRLEVDGQIVKEDGRIAVAKIAIDRVHWLPGVAERLGVNEYVLRETLYRHTDNFGFGDLDRSVYLPFMDNISVYIIGDPDKLKDPECKVTVRVHDECGGSDVFGSDICTCRPYLVHAIEEGVKTAQEGGVGIIVYNDNEGRGLGEVTKFNVYNARKQQPGGDTPDNYFPRTVAVAGAEDARFQTLAVDPLIWLGVGKIHRLVSMSEEKYKAIRLIAGIEVAERVEFPENRLPKDGAVEINAKKAHRDYFHTSDTQGGA